MKRTWKWIALVVALAAVPAVGWASSGTQLHRSLCPFCHDDCPLRK